MIEDIIEYVSWDQPDTKVVNFYDAVFQKNFGPWKKGDTAVTISFALDTGVVKEYDASGTEVIKQGKLEQDD